MRRFGTAHAVKYPENVISIPRFREKTLLATQVRTLAPSLTVVLHYINEFGGVYGGRCITLKTVPSCLGHFGQLRDNICNHHPRCYQADVGLLFLLSMYNVLCYYIMWHIAFSDELNAER